MSLQQFCVRWNNHLKIFQSALPKYFQNQKFLDCTLVVEGQHLVPCHRMVLDACSDYFSNFLKNKIFDDKNLVICLPKEIKMWEIQAILQFMYQGEVCISQEGLPSLVKCAEILQVKGLCGSDPTVITAANSQENDLNDHDNQQMNNKNTSMLTSKDDNILKNVLQKTYSTRGSNSSHNIEASASNHNSIGNTDNAKCDDLMDDNDDDYCPELNTPAIEIDENDSECDFNGQIIKREVNISDVMDDDEDYDDGSKQKYGNVSHLMIDESANATGTENASGRRVRRSEELLSQAAECVRSGQTFQMVSDIFNIPISTIRFYMARKGILPRRKRGRAAVVPMPYMKSDHLNISYRQPEMEQDSKSKVNIKIASVASTSHVNESSPEQKLQSNSQRSSRISTSRSSSPTEPPYHIANYKLPDLRPKLI